MTKDPSVRHRSLDISPTEGKPTEKRPAKERSKADDSMIRRNTLRTRQYEHEFGLNREKTPQVSQGYISSMIEDFQVHCSFAHPNKVPV